MPHLRTSGPEKIIKKYMSCENILFHENHVFRGFAFPAEEIEGVLGHGLSQSPFWRDLHDDISFPAGENEGPTWNR